MIGRLRVIATAVCAGVSLFAFSPLSANAAAQTDRQQTGSLPGGGLYIARRDVAAPTVAIELWYRAPANGYDGATPGISRLALTAVAASAPPHGTPLAELITRVGGSLAINVYPDIVTISVSVPSWQSNAVIKAMTSAYFSPAISDDGYKAALRDCAVAAAESQFDPDRMLQDALFSRIFSSGPAHYPPTPPSAADFTKIPQSAVKAFAARAFRQQNAVLSLAGSLGASWLSQVRTTNGSGAMDAPIDSPLANAAIDAKQSARVSGIGFAWTGPPIADPKAATAMDFLADYLFDANQGVLAGVLRKAKSDSSVSGQFITLHDPGVMLLTLAGGDAASVRGQVEDAVAAAQQPMSASAFDAARNAFEYHILSQTQTPVSRADNFGWYAAEGNAAYAPGDASGAYLNLAQSLDPQYVAQIARKYLQHPAVVQLISAPSGEAGAST